ncbi:MAG TPA: SMP-30/gluconolactonase/LRE family protein [Polaromonas sp.]|uniref:SMP-30/gluconolactonase/LRE family protein n=1 Tax=Polaromonas sp. TaxID=1869339 RepID=UPI002D2BA92F|nr:SMP-30/gluconolactonase/LRE family protein [Polaromonas sp.]HYW55354.1 SMP-30/gluconolactonase/LRE family protein [Polaromonas sp.]
MELSILEPQHEPVQRLPVPPPFQDMYYWTVRNKVGESPVWDVQSQSLFWIDVRAPAVLRLCPSTCRLTRWTLPEVVGALALTADGRLVLALKNSLALLDCVTGELRSLNSVDTEPAGNRLNEGKVSPGGRWFVFGSMDDRPEPKRPTGALYRTDGTGSVRCLLRGLTVANGIAWSPDGTRIYCSDSHAGVIWQAAWQEELGEMGHPALFATSPEVSGRPDGALVDALGNYLSAGVSAGCLNTFDVTGRLLRRLAMPVRAPSMPCLGGEDLSRLFVTSLVRPGWDCSETLDGYLIEMAAPCVGCPPTALAYASIRLQP